MSAPDYLASLTPTERAVAVALAAELAAPCLTTEQATAAILALGVELGAVESAHRASAETAAACARIAAMFGELEPTITDERLAAVGALVIARLRDP